MDPIRITGRITGGEAVERRFLASGDAVRKTVTKAMRTLGRDMRDAARALVPRDTGRLAKSITPKVTSKNREAVKLSIRPTALYGLFIEGGWTKAPYRRGNRKADGSYGPDRKVVVGRGYLGRKNGERIYRGFYVAGEHQRHTPLRDDYGQIIGTRIQKIRAHKVSAYTYKKTTHIAGRSYMEPTWKAMRDEVQPRIGDAVAEALRAAP